MEQMEREARKRLLNTMREQEQEMEQKKRAMEAAKKAKEVAKGQGQTVRKRNVGASRKIIEKTKESENRVLSKKKEPKVAKKKPVANDAMKTLPSTPRLVVFLLFLFVCLFILYFGFGNRSVPLTSKSHALKDNNPPMTEGAGVALDKKERKEGMTEGAGVALDKKER